MRYFVGYDVRESLFAKPCFRFSTDVDCPSFDFSFADFSPVIVEVSEYAFKFCKFVNFSDCVRILDGIIVSG